MSEENGNKNNGNKPRLLSPSTGSHRELNPVRCPSTGCREVFFEIPKEYWLNILEKFTCIACGRVTLPTSCSFLEGSEAILHLHFWCEPCRKNFSYRVTGLRKYCKGCKLYHYLFLYCLLNPPPVQGEVLVPKEGGYMCTEQAAASKIKKVV